MVHNGIEYGVMQAYAEGFDIMRCANQEHLDDGCQYDFNLADISEVWRRGSVIGSWLLDLTAMALMEDPALQEYSGHVSDWNTPATCRIPAKVAGPSWPQSRKPARQTS